VRRRDLIAAIAGAAAGWPLAARAQQRSMPVIGFLDTRSNQGVAERMRSFHQGLKETGHVEGDNIAIVYRWGDNQRDRLPELAADLVRRNVAVIVTSGGPPAALAAKAATSTIPTVFLVGDDPVRLGLVHSLARPGGNRTGVNLVLNEIEGKRLSLLHELLPQAARLAVLVNPADATNTATTLREVGAAVPAFKMQIQVLNASTPREIDTVFESIGRDRPDALFVGASAFLNARRVQLVQLAAAHRLPAIYGLRESAEAGGLISYGSDILDAYRQIGAYAGRILKGAKPADLPVVQQSKFELVINLTTARAQGIAIPTALLARADEVIE
jgi:putative ABC transport system substrate-binding protein